MTAPVAVSITAKLITGAPMALGLAHFELTTFDVDGGIIAPAGIDVALDASGMGTASLLPNVTGVNGTQYRVQLLDANGALQFSGTATVPASACNLHQIINVVAPPKVSDAQAAATAAQGSAAAAQAANVSAQAVLTDSGFVAVKNDLAHIDAVAADLPNIDAVGANIANVNAVGGAASAVNTVAGVAAAVTSVAAIAANVSTVAGAAANVNAVAGDLANINTVAGDLPNIDAVGGSIAAVNSAAANMTAIVAAPAQATAAQAAAAGVQSLFNRIYLGAY